MPVLCERICTAVSQLHFEKIRMSISGGLAELKNFTADKLLSVADERLYIAKHQGKNQIVCKS